MNQHILEVVTNHKCLLGECPVWDNLRKRIFWIDILNGDINYYYPDTNVHKICNLRQVIGAISLKRSGGVMAALKSGFASIDLIDGAIQVIAEIEADKPDNRFNDGKCDPAGRFWAGTMSDSDKPHTGSLYMLDKNYSVKEKISGVSCSNGLAWSPDNKIFYYIDSPTRNVTAYNYDVIKGNISDKRVLITIPKEDGYPDGMTIDTEGMLWIALWGGGKVARYNPYTGIKIYEIILPVSQVTSCVFGGETMEDLYITSANVGLSEQELKAQPLAGSLFVIKRSGFKGMNGFEFNG